MRNVRGSLLLLLLAGLIPLCAGPITFNYYIDPSLFVDISGSGTALGLADDGEANITTSIGNSLIASGTVRVGNNGGIGNAATGDLWVGNEPLPTDIFEGNGLLAFWDDIDSDTGNVYWLETTVNSIPVLIVQWHNRPHYSNTGSTTFQLQLFQSGPVLARFAYADVEFGNAAWDYGASATIGYQESASVAYQFSYNTASLANGAVIDLVAADAVPEPATTLMVAGPLLALGLRLRRRRA